MFRFSSICLLLVSTQALAQQNMSVSDMALEINGAIGQMARACGQQKVAADAAQQQIAVLQKQIADLKAKYETENK